MAVYFPSQKENEKVYITARRHWLVFVEKVFLHIVFGIVPYIFYLVLGYILPTINSHPVIDPAITLFFSLYYLYLLLFIYHDFVDYYLDVWIVTDERIVRIEQLGLFRRTVAEIKLYRIQDVSTEVRGILRTFLGYGSLKIQSAGTEQQFIFTDMPNVKDHAQTINTLVEEYKQKNPLKVIREEIEAGEK